MKKIGRLFEKQYFDLSKAIDKSYIDNGVGRLAVKISHYNDVISRYAGEGYECLNYDFYSYLDRNIRYIPDDVPILLQVYGCKFTKEQKETIVENIREHYQYVLGEVIEDNNNMIRKNVIFLALAVIFLILFIISENNEMISSFVNLVFWFYGSSVVTFFAVDIRKAKKARARAGQIANMFIIIEEKYNKNEITEEDKKMMYEHLKEAKKNDQIRKDK